MVHTQRIVVPIYQDHERRAKKRKGGAERVKGIEDEAGERGEGAKGKYKGHDGTYRRDEKPD